MSLLLDLISIAVGGSLGAIGRYLITLAAVSTPLSGWITIHGCVGTTIANLLGCLLLGGLYQCSETWVAADWQSTMWTPRAVLAFRVGALGSLTTFSTLIGEAAIFASQGRFLASSMLMTVNVVLGWCLFLFAMAAVRSWTT